MFTYIKRYYCETIPAKIQKLEKTVIKNASYPNFLSQQDSTEATFSALINLFC